MAKPLLRWPGGKREIVDRLAYFVPPRYRRYHELFAGGAALYFHLAPHSGTLNDTNRDLIDCYEAVRDDPGAVIKRLLRLRNSEEAYYRVRASSPRNRFTRAARFIYLTNLSFNGIYRVNFRGQFNVPYGHRPHRTICEPVAIRDASRVLKAAKLNCSDFAATVADVEAGDLVYLDPPYTLVHSNNGFIRYNEHLFAWRDQLRLAAVARELDGRGAMVIISNAYHPAIRDLYRGFQVHRIVRSSRIAASAEHRRSVREYVFTNFDLPTGRARTGYPYSGDEEPQRRELSGAHY
jgi:DNA adenine methylase